MNTLLAPAPTVATEEETGLIGKLRPEIKEEWLRRLRSGDYPQGRAALNARGKYCCLGVLCEMAVEAGVIISQDNETQMSYGLGENFTDVWTPSEVTLWALTPDSVQGLSDRDVSDYRWGTSVHQSLAFLNDTLNENDEHLHSFLDIADQIEKDY